jgi:hypothetical protein
MPKLKFLDASAITRSEWSILHSASSIATERQELTEATAAMDRMSLWRKIFKSAPPKQEADEDDSRKFYTPLPDDTDANAPTNSRSSYGRVKHYYKGTESQGNRFIGNTML